MKLRKSQEKAYESWLESKLDNEDDIIENYNNSDYIEAFLREQEAEDLKD